MTERMARRVDDHLEAGYRGAKAIRKDAVKIELEATVQLRAISPRSEEMQIEALKEAYEELRKCMAKENIISAVISRRDNAPSAL